MSICMISLMSCASAESLVTRSMSTPVSTKVIHHKSSQPVQMAVLLYDHGVERLMLEVCNERMRANCVFVLPTPTKPSFSNGNDWLLSRIQFMTAPYMRYWLNSDEFLGRLWGEWDHYEGLWYPESLNPHSRYLEYPMPVLAGYCRTTVFHTQNENDMFKWLEQNDYHANRRLLSIMSDYLKRGWTLTAISIEPTSSHGIKILHGADVVQCMEFTFSTPEPLYPIPIYAVGTGYVDNPIYMISSNRFSQTKLKTEFSNNFYPGEYGISFDSDLQGLWPSARLTKFTAMSDLQHSNNELVFTRSITQALLPISDESPPFLMNLGMLSLAVFALVTYLPFSIALLVVALLIARSKFGRRRWRTWVFAGAACLVGSLCFQRDSSLWSIIFAPHLHEARLYQVAGIVSSVILVILIAVSLCIRLKSFRSSPMDS